ncbi:MAG: regulatory protein GemA [Nitratireductor sp.]|nr:regulatory protein GemA [Nitratireductor sp.]
MTAIAAIHIARKQLGMQDDDYRAMLERVTGKRSSAKMTHAERLAVLAEMERLGFDGSRKPASNGPRKRLEGKYAGKLQALWIAAWNLGLIRDRTDAALVSFVKRQTGIDHVRFVRDGDDAAKAIEALKGWMVREAAVDWVKRSNQPLWKQTSGSRIATAQLIRLGRAYTDLGAVVQDITGRNKWELTREADWVPVMNELGRRIREKSDG